MDAKLIPNPVAQTRNHIRSETEPGLTHGGIGTPASAAAPVDSGKDGMPDRFGITSGAETFWD